MACNPTKRVPEGSHLLVNNSVKVDEKALSTDDLKAIIKQKPNRKILGTIRFHLAVYNFASFGKETKIKNWLKNTVGEPPVLVDSTLTEKSADQLKLYMNNKGFFNAEVTDTTIYKKKKGYVIYKIKANEPYTINKIDYNIKDDDVKAFVLADTSHSLIKKGINFDQDILEAERERVTKKLKNTGYYYFFKEYIFFEADTTIGKLKTNVKLFIESPVQKTVSDTDSAVVSTNHKRYYLENVVINQNYNSKVKPSDLDTVEFNNYIFLTKGPLRIYPSVISNNIFLKKGDLYQTRNVEDTYRKLGELKSFKFINIQFAHPNPASNQLEARINLTPVPRHAFSVITEGTHTGGNLGIAGNLVYQNRNTFRGAEILEIRLKGGMEVQQLIVETEEDTRDNLLPFNTIEIGPEISLSIPKFLLPIKPRKVSKRSSPKTSITAAYNFQQRPDYNRTIANLSFGYFWRETKFKRHVLNPAEVNLVKVFKQPRFERLLEQTGDALIRNSYSDQLITASKYSYIYSNQGSKPQSDNFSFFRLNAELAGNTLSLLENALNYSKDSAGAYQVFNIRFAQYAKADFDYRKYFPLNEISTLVVRTALGAGIPYGNSEALPFIKSFFGGGANDIRAWRARSLGPGSLPDDRKRQFEQIGDLKFVGNLEYRFDIYKLLKAALFYDIGNIWLLREDINRPGGDFQLNRFYNEIAMGTGVGLRFDFSFFIIRIDTALPVKDPSYPEGYRWVIKNPRIKTLNFNLGIGYPF